MPLLRATIRLAGARSGQASHPSTRWRSLRAGERRATESFMRWAIALALEGQGLTSPNPMVGACVVKNGKIVGEGYHRRAGLAHAEINALRDAGRAAYGADLYVTLEPCVHFGRTPPCVDAIARAGIKGVYIGARDPNPIVNGRGIRALKIAGIHVVEGVLEESCRKINEAYNKFIVSGIPFVTAKVALSLDGKMAAAGGDSKWITNDECRAYVHKLRGQVDAVMAGGGTARRDNPKLNVRLKSWHGIEPKAVIVDESLKLPKKLSIFKRAHGQTIIVTTSSASKAMKRFLERKGHIVIVCRSTAGGRVFLPHALRELGKRGISSILLEGGGELFADFFRRKLVDHAVICLAPKLMGGGCADFLPGLSIRHISNAMSLHDAQIQTFGDNVVVEGSLR